MKKRIEENFDKLKTFCPEIEQINRNIEVLIKSESSDDIIEIWIDSVKDKLFLIESSLKKIESKKYKDELLSLKKDIDKYFVFLVGKFPLIYAISENIDVLIEREYDSMTILWLESFSDTLDEIKQEIKDIKGDI